MKPRKWVCFRPNLHLIINSRILLLVTAITFLANYVEASTKLEEIHPANGWILRTASYALTLEPTDGVLLECSKGEPKLDFIFQPVGSGVPNPKANYYVKCEFLQLSGNSPKRLPKLNQLNSASGWLLKYANHALSLEPDQRVLVECLKGEPKLSRVFQQLSNNRLDTQPYDYIRCGEWHSFSQ